MKVQCNCHRERCHLEKCLECICLNIEFGIRCQKANSADKHLLKFVNINAVHYSVQLADEMA